VFWCIRDYGGLPWEGVVASTRVASGRVGWLNLFEVVW
jgi:hypothetical protein